jgi:UDP-N-acetylglucosamine:LPS N-acetylglucosamine transferase
MLAIMTRTVMLVSSPGGHLADLLLLTASFPPEWRRVWVLNDESPLLPIGEPRHIVTHAERDWRQVLNLFEFYRLVARERPDAILTCGASPAVPAALAGKLFGVPTVYVEPVSSVTRLSLTGKLMRHLAAAFFVQWDELAQATEGARCVGPLL